MATRSLPPGFRFHPTDEELVDYYLKGKVQGWKTDLEIIPEVDIYKCEPWDLPQKSLLPARDLEWYFFCSRNRKYPNGSRTNRATKAGYWKATGKERKVTSHKRLIGIKKTLVFHGGRAPHGSRTNWVMHEYRLDNNECEASASFEDAYALCRILKKREPGPKIGEQSSESVEKDFSCGFNNLFNKNSFYWVEEQYEEKPSPLWHTEEDQNNSNESPSETKKDINTDDGALKRFQLLDFDNPSFTFPFSNESTNHPKVEHYECSWPPLEVEDFPDIKTCLNFSGTYVGGRQIHWPVKETEMLEQLYPDAKTSQENSY